MEVQCADMKMLVNATDEELGGRDIYTMCRMYNDGYEAFIDTIHNMGGQFVFDSDDDLTEDYKLVSGRGDEFKRVLYAADYVTCSTPTVAEHFNRYTQREPVVLRNCIDVDWMQEVASKGKRIVEGTTIGFSGSPTHWGDWYIPAVPWARIGRELDVTLVTHGEVPRYLKFAGEKAELLQLGGVPFSIYPVLVKQFDIMLCSVDSRDQFNSGKSAVKALECMALGVVPICSRFRPYMELKEAGAPVIIVEEETRDAWYKEMWKIIDNECLRHKLSTMGPRWVKKNRDISIGYKQWADFYRGIAN
jgi:glycosyltransferase involved in cell wall biosynthesis